jgi:excisionase family DNA binding protein
MKDFFTVNELAEHFGVNPKTIYRLVEKGEIPGLNIDGEWILSKEDVFRAMYRGLSLEELWQFKEEAEGRSRRTIEKMKLLQLRERFHQSVVRSLKKNLRGHKWESVVGYDLDTLKRRLKRTIPEGYSWQDFINGNLHLDHIIPGSAFNIENIDSLDLKRSWELRNLRLIPAKENIKKGYKLSKPFQPSLALRG